MSEKFYHSLVSKSNGDPANLHILRLIKEGKLPPTQKTFEMLKK
jgi:hypothetical protein